MSRMAGYLSRPCSAGVRLPFRLALPLLVASGRCAVRTFGTPRLFVPAMRRMLGCYLAGVGLFGAGILLQAWRGMPA